MIWRLHKVLTRELALLTLVCSLGLTFLFSVLGLYQIVNRFEVTPHFSTLLSFAPSLAVSLLPLTMPISALFAGAMVFGRMRAERELLLVSASGISPWRPFLGLIPIGIVVAFVAWFGVSEFGPEAYAQRHSLQRKALADFLDHPPQGPRELRFPGSGGLTPSIDISYAAVDEGVYRDLTVFVYNEEGLVASLHAASARIEYRRHDSMLSLTRCFEPRLIQYMPSTGRPSGTPLVADRVDELRVPFSFGSEAGPESSKALNSGQLVGKVREELSGPRGGRSAAAELVRRAGLTLAGLLLPLLGALLAAMVNHPNRLLAIGAGVIPAAVGYYPLMTASATLAEKATLSPLAAALLAPGAALLAVFVCAWRITQGRWK
ncbi:MAG: LptF/LptG family permease [Planctomycetes bacterium]|nr:LptF/LptG family permease [Planctomycetota bacterium]